MDILEAPKDLVEEVANVVVAQLLAFEQLVQVCLHQVLHNIDIPHDFQGGCPQNVSNANNVLMAEAQQDLDLPQCALAVGLMLKGADFLDGHANLARMVIS